MNTPGAKVIQGAGSTQQLLFEKVKLLLARERELNALRQQYERYQQWLGSVQRITAALSCLENRGAALRELVQELVADSSYEFAAAVNKGETFYFGVTPDAADSAAIDDLAKQVIDGVSLKVVVAEPRQISWLMAGPVVHPGSRSCVDIVLFVGRTRRTTGFFPPPWEAEKVLFQQLLPTMAHVFMAVDFRSALIAERNLLKGRVADATAQLQSANERLEVQIAQRTEELRETNELLVKELHERERAEQARAALQEEMIRMQRAQLEEMSTPLIPITDEMVVMPLIGTVDKERARQVLETAVDGAQRHQAKVVILDVTGMKQIDTCIAGTLVTAASALRLLGTKTILTGIRAEAAQTLVSLGVDLSSLLPRSTLQSGIAYAMNLTHKWRRSGQR